MADDYITVYREAEGYYEEKKSRFISGIYHVESEEEVRDRLQQIRKTRYDASHHCYAYVLGKKMELKKSSDDGEPQGTAGHPILAVLEGESLCDALIVVTRYFGGTLLGTGGLVRSYTRAAQDAVNQAVLAHKYPADLLRISVDYNGIGKLQYYFQQEGLSPAETVYTDAVSLLLPVPSERTEAVSRKMTDLLNGKIRIERERSVYYARIGNESILFE